MKNPEIWLEGITVEHCKALVSVRGRGGGDMGPTSVKKFFNTNPAISL